MAGHKAAARSRKRKAADPHAEWRPSKMPRRLTIAEKAILRQENEAANLASRFFKLPGELRNTIYEMCLEETDVTMVHDPFETPPWKGDIPWKMELAHSGRKKENAPGRALTQVYRQLRAEFMSVYKKTSVIHIHVSEVDAFMKTWQCDQAGGIMGTLVIDMWRFGFDCDPSRGRVRREDREVYRCGISEEDPDEPRSPPANYYDIFPLVELRRANPAFRFFIGSTKLDNPCTLTELSSLDHARQTTEKPLCEYDVRFFEHTISKIEIGCTDHLEADIYFHIKEGYEHLWLPDDYEEGQPIRGTKAKTYIMRMWANEVHGISREAKAFRKSLHMTLMWKDHFFEKPAYYGKAEEDGETYDESIALFAGSGEDTSA
jgi:hypothetical protein